MQGHDIVVIGASAGGVDALSRLIRDLPADLPAAVFAVVHLSPDMPSALPRIVERAGLLVVDHAADGSRVEHGHVYLAQPNRHLVLSRGRMHIQAGPRENRHRPSVDVLFRSAANSYGRRVIGVILSGGMNDGAAGLRDIVGCNGTAMVQDPEDALVPTMPRSAIETLRGQANLFIAPLRDLARRIVLLCNTEVKGDATFPPKCSEPSMAHIVAPMPEPFASYNSSHGPVEGELSLFTCPECSGPVWESHAGNVVFYRCRFGHAYTAESFLEAQGDAVERAVWFALRTLQERMELARHIAERSAQTGSAETAEAFERKAARAQSQAGAFLRAIMDGNAG